MNGDSPVTTGNAFYGPGGIAGSVNTTGSINNSGIMLIIFLVMIIIFLIFLIVILAIRDSAPTTPCGFSTFGVMPNFDNVALSTCGSNKSSPCVFQVNSVSDAISQCEDLNCTSFSFNDSTLTMKIINLQGAYSNVLSDIYSRN